MLVGGAAVEIYTRGAVTTGDFDVATGRQDVFEELLRQQVFEHRAAAAGLAETIGKADVEISLALLKYARYARGGRITEPAILLNSNLDRKPQLVDPEIVIKGAVEAAEPVVEEAVEELRASTGLDAPGADLLASDPYAALTDGVTQGDVVGSAFIGGVESDHLAFRTDIVDWQIWIAQGEHPYPCRYVITSKGVDQGPHLHRGPVELGNPAFLSASGHGPSSSGQEDRADEREAERSDHPHSFHGRAMGDVVRHRMTATTRVRGAAPRHPMNLAGAAVRRSHEGSPVVAARRHCPPASCTPPSRRTTACRSPVAGSLPRAAWRPRGPSAPRRRSGCRRRWGCW